MARKRATVNELASEASVDVDEALIALWDGGIGYVNGPGDLVGRGDVNRARRILGLATRRELADRGHWQGILNVDDAAFDALLLELGVKRLPQGGRLPKKAIHRLKAEARRLGVSPDPVVEDHQATTDATPPSPPFIWPTVGHVRDVHLLSVDQVRAIHRALVDDFHDDNDPIDPPGVRSEGLLASAVFRPATAVGGIAKYPTVEMAAAALLHSLVHNHPFHNGNKRTALVAMLALLDENSLMLTCDQDVLFKLVLQLAQHVLATGPRAELPDREVVAIARWLEENARWTELGDRPIPWRRLRRILSQHGCQFESPPGVGNRMNILRTVNRKRLFGGVRPKALRTQSYYGDEGRELDKNSVNRIRHELELDDLHGIDSREFYDSDPASHSEFIVKYRKTLRRLAKL